MTETQLCPPQTTRRRPGGRWLVCVAMVDALAERAGCEDRLAAALERFL
jgi:hypothetical protein